MPVVFYFGASENRSFRNRNDLISDYLISEVPDLENDLIIINKSVNNY